MKVIIIFLTIVLTGCSTIGSSESQKSTVDPTNLDNTTSQAPSLEELKRRKVKCGSDQSCHQEIQRKICELYGCQQQTPNNDQQRPDL